MATEIKVWQVENGKLVLLDTTMPEAGRTEPKDLQPWIKSNPDLLGQDILVIGEHVRTRSGEIDFLAVDRLGNVVIIELKRDRLPREVLAQAIDYASDVVSWDLDRLNQECMKYNGGQELVDCISEKFPGQDPGGLSLNHAQRILLVGTFVEESLQRMIQWLSDKYDLAINALIFRYIRTKNNEELLARTMIISEDIEKEKSEKQQRKIPLSDEPGAFEEEELRNQLRDYLKEERDTPFRIKTVLLPLCLQHDIVTRDMIKKELVKQEQADDEGKAGTMLTTISRELGIEWRSYLRQIISYKKDELTPWEKENYRINNEYKVLVGNILEELQST